MSNVEWKTCRVCGDSNLTSLFSLGEQYVSDFVEPGKEKEGHRCPIELDLCNNCTLVQQRYTAPQDFLYTRKYWYRSGVTQTMRDSLREVTYDIEKWITLQPGDVVLDIGSNDGTLLRSYANPNLTRVGVEPASNLAEEGSKGIDCLIKDFWDHEYRDRYGSRSAKVITALGMFYDLEDPNKFISDVAKSLAPDGVFVAQLMCLKQTVEQKDVGNLAHEHLEFYSLQSLVHLFAMHGLEIFDIQENAVNGGSYRLWVQHTKTGIHPVTANYWYYRNIENGMGLNDPNTYIELFKDMERNKTDVQGHIEDLSNSGKRIWVYGASTKGNVLLQYYGLDNDLIDGAAERSPEKYGKVCVGTGIPIYNEDYARDRADYFLVLPYAFINEFKIRELYWRKRGGKFIVPLPTMEIV